MPYRHAYRWLLLLFPIVGLAFWPGYFGRLASAEWELHLHGITASLWIVLTALQSWSIHHRSIPLHRLAGRASLLLFPLFWISGLFIVRFQAVGFATSAGAFHTAFGAPLSGLDIVTSGCVAALYLIALARRRTVAVHAAAMLAIPLFLAPPIIVRLLQIIPIFAVHSAAQTWRFAMDLHLCNLLSAIAALWLYRKRPSTAWPFLIVVGAMVAESLFMATVAVSPQWAAMVRLIAAIPIGAVALGGFLLSTLIVSLGWTRGAQKRAAPPARTAPPDVAVAG
jgi:hypothetical protein